MKNKLILIAGSSLAMFSIFGCNRNQTLTLDKTSINLAIGENTTLTAKLGDRTQKVTFTSDNESIANVNKYTGTITPISGGITTIRATDDNGHKASCEVRVRMKTIILGIDGAGDFFDETHTPNTWKIFINNTDNNSVATVNHGCLTSNPTISAQCWGSMLCGVSPEIHKFTNESIKVTPNTSHHSIFYEAAHQISSVKLASIVNWTPINTGIVEDGLGVMKDDYSSEDDITLKDAVIDYLTYNEPDLLYVQFDSVDHAGHTYDYGSALYYEQLSKVDGYIGDIYNVLNTRKLLNKYDFIVTADHGGKDYQHGGWTDQEKYTFFGITGDNIQKHTDRRAINNMNVIDTSAILAHALAINNCEDWGAGIPGGIKVPNNIFIN